MLELLKKLAEEIKSNKGRLFYVGGVVRDELLGLPNKDLDCECFGIEESCLNEILENFAFNNNLSLSFVGKSFKVWKLRDSKNFEADISLPREDRKVGIGHKGFEVVANPLMSYEMACSRRDLTINAIMKDVLTGEVIDPFNGLKDLKKKVLKVVSPKSFKEDSLRVLRLAQFASRFKFKIASRTIWLALDTDLSDLPKERIWGEVEKLLMKSSKPSYGSMMLKQLDITRKLFPELWLSIDVEFALDRAKSLITDLSYPEQLTVMLAVLLRNSPISILNDLGVTNVDNFKVIEQVENIHYRLNYKDLCFCSIWDYTLHKLSQECQMDLMGKVLEAFEIEGYQNFNTKIKELGIEKKPLEPILKGRHLIEMGMKPSPEFGEILSSVYDAQIGNYAGDLEQAKELAKMMYDANRPF